MQAQLSAAERPHPGATLTAAAAAAAVVASASQQYLPAACGRIRSAQHCSASTPLTYCDYAPYHDGRQL